ncbi:MAG: hypothetical protein ACJAZV_001086, partial [Roseivirga sp.]
QGCQYLASAESLTFEGASEAIAQNCVQ